jgi:hypothetical protein
MYSVLYYPRFHVTAVGFGTYCPWIRGHTCDLFFSSFLGKPWASLHNNMCSHSGYVSTLTPVSLFVCRIQEAAPILTDDSTDIKFRGGTSQTPIRNKNRFVSSDELHQRSKKTLQGLLPQVNGRSRNITYAWKTNKYTNYYLFSLLIMYGSSYMFRHYVAILRERFLCLLRGAQLKSSR